jgi:hypothetical protein
MTAAQIPQFFYKTFAAKGPSEGKNVLFQDAHPKKQQRIRYRRNTINNPQ